VTGGDVARRVANAKLDPTFLMADVEIIATYELYNIGRIKLENLIHRIFDPARLGLPRANVFFELTKEAKLARIASSGVSHFVDDLPEFLAAPGFPGGVQRILFDPNNLYAEEKFTRAQSWAQIKELLPW